MFHDVSRNVKTLHRSKYHIEVSIMFLRLQHFLAVSNCLHLDVWRAAVGFLLVFHFQKQEKRPILGRFTWCDWRDLNPQAFADRF